MNSNPKVEITAQQLRELESNQTSVFGKLGKRIITIVPVLILLIHILEYNFMPNYGTNTCTNTYNVFLFILTSGFGIAFILSLFWNEIFYADCHYACHLAFCRKFIYYRTWSVVPGYIDSNDRRCKCQKALL